MNNLWAVGGALLGLMYGLHRHGEGTATWREVVCMIVLGVVVALVARDMLGVDWSSSATPGDHFG